MMDWFNLDDLLVAHAARALPAPIGAAVASHLALSPQSRERFEEYEALGGVLLDAIEPEPLHRLTWRQVVDGAPQHAPTWSAHLGKAHARPTHRVSADRHHDELPAPLRAYAPRGLAGLRWRNYGDLREAEVATGTPDYRMRFVRLRSGRNSPRHTHDGHEVTLVLDGGFTDRVGNYRRGDLVVADASIDHQPRADDDGDCVCLAITDAPLRLTGPLLRFLNPFLRF